MWNKLHYKQKHELMKSYRNGGYSYREMVDDYNDSYQKFAEGREKDESESPPTTNTNYNNNLETYYNNTDKYLNNLTDSGLRLSNENKRVKDVREKTAEIALAKSKSLDPSTRTDLSYIKSGAFYCNTHTGECLQDAGATTKSGKKMPIIPGNIQWDSKINDLGFEWTDNPQPGDVAREQIFREKDYQGNQLSPGYYTAHSGVVTQGGENLMIANSQGGSRYSYKNMPVLKMTNNNPNVRMKYQTYVGNKAELENQYRQAQVDLNNQGGIPVRQELVDQDGNFPEEIKLPVRMYGGRVPCDSCEKEKFTHGGKTDDENITWQDEGSKNLKPKAKFVPRMEPITIDTSGFQKDETAQVLPSKYKAQEQAKAAGKAAVEGSAETLYNQHQEREELKKRYPGKSDENINLIQEKINNPWFNEPSGQLASYLTRFKGLSEDELASITGDGSMGNRLGIAANMAAWGLANEVGGKLIGKGIEYASPYIRKGLNAAGKAIGTESGVLSNAYKLNPKALKEAQEQMLVRARPVGQDPYINMAEQLKAKQAAGEQLTWYQKNLLNPQTNPQMAAREKYFGQWFADNPSDLDFYINPGTRNFADNAQIEILKARMPKSEAAKYNVKNFEDAKTISNLHDTEYILPKDMVQQAERYSVDDLSKLMEEYNQINKPHWLKGYPEVPKNTSNFKSEINWGNWNKEILNNKALMNEYNAIEQSTKANGSWMKNPDGSLFQGTPEQFVQQNSSNFKKAFPEGANRTYRGTTIHNNNLTDNYNSVFTADKAGASGYTRKGMENKYFNPNIPNIEEQISIGAKKYGMKEPVTNKSYRADIMHSNEAGMHELYYTNKDKIIADFKNSDFNDIKKSDIPKELLEYLPNKKTYFTDDIAEALEKSNFSSLEIKNIIDPFYIERETIHNLNKSKLKSARGNNGMFDMTNPNIYKALFPTLIGAAALNEKKQGGQNNWLNKYS